ncbi:transmembrane protein 56 [Selaginella moellendorffii]|uniref:transmembrane protein 56 n=1 Tax=Selaginella moellendorffii TaxID=88036 RepID=UPI000D1C357D|nr:transmembrane protein 56 [Selaginella moellendorffii]|eukprot:XP_024527921.1 transmembrane protein 56 [Selaginella moellendorffii]
MLTSDSREAFYCFELATSVGHGRPSIPSRDQEAPSPRFSQRWIFIFSFLCGFSFVTSAMEKAVLFQTQLEDVMGDFGYKKPLLWATSILTGILMSTLVSQTKKPLKKRRNLPWIDRLVEQAFESMKAYGPVLFPNAYTKLSDKDRVEWNNRAISFTHAVVATLVAGYLFFVSDLFREEVAYGPVVFRSTIFTQFFLGVSNGYFITDMAMLLKYYPNLGEIEFVVHHAVSIISLFLAVHSGYAHIYLYTVLLSESTTPFINIRWYLAAADMKKTRAYTINGIALFVSWLVSLSSSCYKQEKKVIEIDTIGYYFMFFSTSVFAVMNLYWFEKIARGLIKVLKSKET